MKKLTTILLAVILGISCEIYFPNALSTTSKNLPKITFKTSNSDNVIYANKNMEINSSDVGRIIITKPNITITFKAPFTEKSLTNIQKIKSITDNTASATLIFKGGDYYIGNLKINDDKKTNKKGFKIQTPNNSRLFVKNFEIKNNKTLLGIDSNNNGIRDDVEIKILTFKPRICNFKPDSKECKISENPAFIAVSFQNARAFQTVLKEFDGSKKTAYELTKIEDRAVDCDSYFTIDNKYWYEYSGKLVEGWVLNTKERKNFYYEYDKQLSGGLFPIGKKSGHIKGCDFNVTEVESELQRGIKWKREQYYC